MMLSSVHTFKEGNRDFWGWVVNGGGVVKLYFDYARGILSNPHFV